MASILDLAVVALAVMVCGTLGLLAWTLGIAVPVALRRARRDILVTRLHIAVVERRVREGRVREGRPSEPIRPNGSGGDE